MNAQVKKTIRHIGLTAAMAATVSFFGSAALAQDKEPAADDPRVKLLEAVLTDDAGTVQDLLVRGVNPNVREVDRGPAVVMAASAQSYRALGQLIAAPATNLEATDQKGETALMIVTRQGNVSAAKDLIKRGALVNRPGLTPLHVAARTGHFELVELLLESKADPNVKASDGSTPMMLAARNGNFTAYETIVRAGADPTVKNANQQTAADLLEARGEAERARLLREYAKVYQARTKN